MTTRIIYKTPGDLPESIPIFPLAGAIVLPRGNLPLNIFEPRYLEMVDAALAGDRLIGMIQPVESSQGGEDLLNVGCIARIVSFAETDDGRYLITLKGVCRFTVTEELEVTTPYRQVRPDCTAYTADFFPDREAQNMDREALYDGLERYFEANSLDADWDSIKETDGEDLINYLSIVAPVGLAEKQALLEAPDCVDRTDILITLIDMAVTPTASNDNEQPIVH